MAHASPPARRSASPPDPRSPGFWRSPLRGLRFTAVLGLVLLAGVTVLFVTGLLSYAAYSPGLAGNDKTPDKGWLGFYLFPWPTSPYWLYRLTQGVHVVLGLALVPVLLAKLWSVIPKLFVWPPVRSPAQALERLTLLLLVGGVVFEFVTGILNIQLAYLFPGSFYALHFYGAWVCIAGFVSHVALKLPRALRAVRGRREPTAREPERTGGATAVPDEGAGLRSPRPVSASLSRRGALAVTGLGSLTLLVLSAGQSIGGVWRRTALLAPHGGPDPGTGANGFQINKTAAHLGIRADDIGRRWRLTVRGRGREIVLGRAELLALPQNDASLPIACVEGWSTDDQRWSGVRLTDLAALAGIGPGDELSGVVAESVQRGGSFRSAALGSHQVRDPRSLLALRVNGADLSADHGFPARVIAPGVPGVHNTKWVTRLDFDALREPRP